MKRFLALLGAFLVSSTSLWAQGPAPAPDQKLVIYQLMTRLFSNTVTVNKTYGTLAENGVGKFNGITDKALGQLKDLGITHVWTTGVIRHATMTDYQAFGLPAGDADVIKGRAGSPYAIVDYYDVSPDLAVSVKDRMKEFEALAQRVHKQGLKLLIDFVPNHVARGYKSMAKPKGVEDLGEKDDTGVFFSPDNNFYYLQGESFQVPKKYNPLEGELAPGEDNKFAESPAKVTGNDRYVPNPSKDDWFETVKLNYGFNIDDDVMITDPIPSTWKKMKDILLYWAGKGVDGFRCDMAEMVPVEFWAWTIPQVKKAYPGTVFIAEIYKRTIYEDYWKKGGFDYLYDKVGLYDTLRPLTRGEGKVEAISQKLEELPVPQGVMLRFLENHDEQRVASPKFAGDPFKALGAMAVSAALGPGPVLIYFGQEVGEKGQGVEGFQGEDGRTTIFDYWGVPAHQRWMNQGAFDGGQLSKEEKALRQWYKTLLTAVRKNPALKSGDTKELGIQGRVYSWIRRAPGQTVVCAVNFDLNKPASVKLSLPEGYSFKGKKDSLDLLESGLKVSWTDGKSEFTLPPGGVVFLEIK